MKNIFKLVFTFTIISVTLMSCDKVEQPIKPEILIDTTLFADGNWVDYPAPTFGSNTNTDRNLLLEDYTGHKCPNCPAAAIIAKDIELANPGRVFVASIHAGAGGNDGFQVIPSDCGTASNPNGEFCHDFRTDEGTQYGITFQPFGFVGNPYGSISRYTFSDFMFQYHNTWEAKTDELLLANDLKVNIQAESNFYEASNGGYLHIESQFLENLSSNYNIVTYVIQNELVEWQDVAGTYVENYHHHNIFLGCIDGEAWGTSVASSPQSGDIFETVYSYVLPTGIAKEELHFLSYVYDVGTYEILQVIKHDFN